MKLHLIKKKKQITIFYYFSFQLHSQKSNNTKLTSDTKVRIKLNLLEKKKGSKLIGGTKILIKY